MDFTQIMNVVSRGFEVVGIAVLVIGFLTGLFLALRDFLRGERSGIYRMIRKYFGQSILLGLEILVAADLIRTVAVDPTMENVLVLGLDRAHPHVPQLLARDRDRRHGAVAALAPDGARTAVARQSQRHRLRRCARPPWRS